MVEVGLDPRFRLRRPVDRHGQGERQADQVSHCFLSRQAVQFRRVQPKHQFIAEKPDSTAAPLLSRRTGSDYAAQIESAGRGRLTMSRIMLVARSSGR